MLHPPYTIWHLSYIVLGISLAPSIHVDRSIATILAFFLGLGVGAHSLDETMGNPLQTRLSKTSLYLIGFSSLGIAIGIGLYYAISLSLLLLPIVAAETFFAVSYNLEMFGKKFHNSWVFSLSWGVIPLITGYFVNAMTLTPGIILVSIAAGLLTYVQRILSTPARYVRRRLLVNESSQDKASELLVVSERALKALNLMILVLAFALLIQKALR